jgi:2-polyprenyl-6-methoxyphenol hydroxylase-like FAD-dependent oxidoreductase
MFAHEATTESRMGKVPCTADQNLCKRRETGQDAMTHSSTEPTDVPVLIIGGSLIGLSTALFLSWHGVPCLVVEKHRGTAIHPRAGYFQLRTLELMRAVGLEELVRETSAAQFDPDGGINAVETLAGREIAHYISNCNADVADVSPTIRLFLSQQRLEPVLRDRAEQLGAQMTYATEVADLAQDANGVTATLRDIDTGAERQIRAQYVVACDGNRSPVRERLGIPMQGYGLLSNSVTIYFRADCETALAGRNMGVIYVDNPDLRGFFRLEKSGKTGFLVVFSAGDPADPESRNIANTIDEARCIDLVRQAVGDPALAVEVLDLAKWRAVADVAATFQHGRIFLAGDAAHTMPPTGGYGGNTGIQDAHNISWKLAAVLAGQAAPSLLDTYSAERQPVGRLAIEQAFLRYVLRCDPKLGRSPMPAMVPDMMIEIGNRYRSAAVLAEPDAADDGLPFRDPRTAKGLPGTRAPHVALQRAGAHLSSLDLFNRGFVLLAGAVGGAWAEAAQDAAVVLGVTLDAYCLDGAGDVRDPAGLFTEAYGISASGAVLVRPDGYVGWRAATLAADPRAALGAALAAILGRTVAAAAEPVLAG